MPHNITDSDVFTDPATRPADGEPGSAATWLGPFQALANRTRFIVNQLGGVLGANEWTYRSARPRQKMFNLGRFAFDDGVGSVANWERAHGSASRYAKVLTAAAVAECDLDLPHGAILTGLEVSFSASSARSGGSRWQFRIYKSVLGVAVPGAPSLIGTMFDDAGGTGNLKKSITGLTEEIDNSTTDYWLEVQAPTGSLAIGDQIFCCRAAYNVGGPRGTDVSTLEQIEALQVAEVGLAAAVAAKDAAGLACGAAGVAYVVARTATAVAIAALGSPPSAPELAAVEAAAAAEAAAFADFAPTDASRRAAIAAWRSAASAREAALAVVVGA